MGEASQFIQLEDTQEQDLKAVGLTPAQITCLPHYKSYVTGLKEQRLGLFGSVEAVLSALKQDHPLFKEAQEAVKRAEEVDRTVVSLDSYARAFYPKELPPSFELRRHYSVLELQRYHVVTAHTVTQDGHIYICSRDEDMAGQVFVDSLFWDAGSNQYVEESLADVSQINSFSAITELGADGGFAVLGYADFEIVEFTRNTSLGAFRFDVKSIDGNVPVRHESSPQRFQHLPDGRYVILTGNNDLYITGYPPEDLDLRERLTVPSENMPRDLFHMLPNGDVFYTSGTGEHYLYDALSKINVPIGKTIGHPCDFQILPNGEIVMIDRFGEITKWSPLYIQGARAFTSDTLVGEVRSAPINTAASICVLPDATFITTDNTSKEVTHWTLNPNTNTYEKEVLATLDEEISTMDVLPDGRILCISIGGGVFILT